MLSAALFRWCDTDDAALIWAPTQAQGRDRDQAVCSPRAAKREVWFKGEWASALFSSCSKRKIPHNLDTYEEMDITHSGHNHCNMTRIIKGWHFWYRSILKLKWFYLEDSKLEAILIFAFSENLHHSFARLYTADLCVVIIMIHWYYCQDWSAYDRPFLSFILIF